jgi:heme-degrading monooxygenase HmoA
MIVALFSTKLRADADIGDYEATGQRMVDLVQQLPGFVSMESYAGDDGAELTVARFTSEAAVEEWRTNPEHLEAQAAGRDRFYERYHIEICSPVRSYSFDRSVERAGG